MIIREKAEINPASSAESRFALSAHHSSGKIDVGQARTRGRKSR
jgi:hypothetical protein